MGDITRLRILAEMSERGGTIQCARIIEFTELAQPSVSHHVKSLVEAGLIEQVKDGRNYTYSLNKVLISRLSKTVEQLAMSPAANEEAG